MRGEDRKGSDSLSSFPSDNGGQEGGKRMYGFSRQEWFNRVCPILRRERVTFSRPERLTKDVQMEKIVMGLVFPERFHDWRTKERKKFQ